MPSYDYACSKCKITEEKIHRMSETPEYKCPKCGKKMERLISLNRTGFIFKGGTETIHYKEKRNRLKKREAIKQNKVHGDGPKLKPNIAGVEVDSWSDAKKLAKEAGLNHESYTPYVEKENKNKIIV